MTYSQALAYVHSLLQFGVRPGLERMRLLMERLGNPQEKCRAIHVAGTNGKGSTCVMLAEILHAGGYRTGLFTSPYVLDFRERIRIDGKMINPDAFAGWMDVIRPHVDALAAQGMQPTEFEVITAAAFCYFAQENCDVVVLETGLGGRLDSTNLLPNPLLCILTSISMDHMAVLGDTLEKIAAEKAGIIKPNVPVVCYPGMNPRALRVIQEKAAACNSRVILAKREHVEVGHIALSGTQLVWHGTELHLPLIGLHQIDNAATVLTAVDVLRQQGFVLSERHVADGIGNARIPARMELIRQEPLVLLDGAHNEEGIAVLAENLRRYLDGKPLTVVMGVMADKAWKQAVQQIAPLCRRFVATTPSNPRALPATELAQYANAYCTDCIAVDIPVQAYHTAYDALQSRQEALLVCGSLYLAGDVREELLQSRN